MGTKNICEKKLKKGVDKPFQKVQYNTRKEQTNNTYLATMQLGRTKQWIT